MVFPCRSATWPFQPVNLQPGPANVIVRPDRIDARLSSQPLVEPRLPRIVGRRREHAVLDGARNDDVADALVAEPRHIPIRVVRLPGARQLERELPVAGETGVDGSAAR